MLTVVVLGHRLEQFPLAGTCLPAALGGGVFTSDLAFWEHRLIGLDVPAVLSLFPGVLRDALALLLTSEAGFHWNFSLRIHVHLLPGVLVI